MRTTKILPGEFEPHRHWYEKALNATIHPMIHFFLNLSMDRIVNRYCHLHPQVDPRVLQDILLRRCRHFLWAGADLFNVTSAGGKRQMVIIENNSCPSGQKSMPLFDDTKEQGGYRFLIERSFKPYVRQRRQTVKGGLAVVYDKNPVEASGYAAVMADVFEEPVHYVAFRHSDPDPAVRFGADRIMEVRDAQGQWVSIRAAFRYLTQKPWNRLPTHSRTRIYNPITACLAGGRNKMVAAKAYDIYNSELASYNLKINTPETIWDVSKNEVLLWVQKMGGQAVIKVPYSNAGQGVFTIVTPAELEQFLAMDFDYDQFIVQSLIGNYRWSSVTRAGRLYHVGTIPNTKGNTYVADIRMMVCSTPEGIRPLSVYARRAGAPLTDHIESGTDSWAMLGTNLSVKRDDGSWGSDTNRLLLMDRRDFNKLGLGLDDLIEAYIQTVLSMVAIDKMGETLTNKQGRFRMRLFRSLNDDPALLEEVFH
jgi:hypothetical protein